MDALYEELARPFVEMFARSVKQTCDQIAPTQPPAPPVQEALKKKPRKNNAKRGGYVRVRA